MHINSRITGSFPEVGSIGQADRVDQRSDSSKAPAAQLPSDSVQISDAGRARAASAPAPAGLDADRVAQIQQRIVSGAYNSLDMVDEVARRILDSGNL